MFTGQVLMGKSVCCCETAQQTEFTVSQKSDLQPYSITCILKSNLYNEWINNKKHA